MAFLALRVGVGSSTMTDDTVPFGATAREIFFRRIVLDTLIFMSVETLRLVEV